MAVDKSTIKHSKQMFTYQNILSLIRKKGKYHDHITKEYYEEAYKLLFNNHRFEYIYKNEITNLYYKDILEGKKKLLYELELYEGNMLISILDLLLISDKGTHAIEIKSDFDSPLRLFTQIPNYSKLFQYVSIFVSEDHLHTYENYLNSYKMDHVGIILMGKDRIYTYRQAKSNNIDKEVLLDNLKLIYPTIEDKGESVEELYNEWITALYRRKEFDKKFFTRMPRSLKFFAYSHSYMAPLKKARLVKHFF